MNNQSVFYNNNKFWKYISYSCLIKRPTKLYISTYNTWIAISNYKDKLGKPILKSPPLEKLNTIQKIVRYMDLLNQNGENNSCLLLGNTKGFNRDKYQVSKMWPYFKVRCNDKHHSKIVIIYYGNEKEVWCGSMNFSLSSYDNIMVKVSRHNKIIEQYNEWIKKANRIC